MAVMDVSESTVYAVAAVAPKTTDETSMKPVPVIVTVVPPSALPDVGDIAVTAGGSCVVVVVVVDVVSGEVGVTESLQAAVTANRRIARNARAPVRHAASRLPSL
jgi:hypothetical protein